MLIVKVYNFKGLFKFERVGGKKKIWLREGKNVKNFEWGDIVGLRFDIRFFGSRFSFIKYYLLCI